MLTTLILTLLLPTTATAIPETTRPIPIVAELFTSQGCSSCPPADRLFAKLQARAGTGVEIIPLAFHVDYWDSIGWPDPFASPAWSARQRDYAAAFRTRRVYTPQLVVNGRVDGVGSDARLVNRLLEEAVADGTAVQVDATWIDGAGAGEATVEARAAVADNLPANAEVHLLMAVFDGGHATSVQRGENARRTLENEFVVRYLEDLGAVDREADGSRVRQGSFEIDAGWNHEAMGVAILAQDVRTRVIYGAAVARPATASP